MLQIYCFFVGFANVLNLVLGVLVDLRVFCGKNIVQRSVDLYIHTIYYDFN